MPDPVDPKADPPADPKTDPVDPELGDAGKKALDTERSARRAAEKTAKENATELEQLRAKLKEHEDAQLTETEKLRKQLADVEASRTQLEREHQESRARSAIEREAAKAGFADPADAWGLLDHAELTYDENGAPSNAEALLKKLVEAKPYLAARRGAGPLPGGGAKPPTGVDMNSLIRQAAGRE